ncbi:hypothetical protein BaRGS_00014830 [Batillaria attramentaria]|uniref:[Histone H3]-dimethyl-L-lysine(36) demethylase n=1 Tax=Batillaria attramentaria TaxID=370345 RepID=A0ABD0L3S2_9CAEN
MASEAEPVYCLCRKPYDETQFMIECDVCNDWFHGSCVGVQEHQAADIEIYHCPRCEEEHGPLVLKKRRNWHRHDYSEEEYGKAVQTGTIVFIKELKNRTFPSADEVLIRLSGGEVTVEYFEEHGFQQPIMVEKKDGLGLLVPPPTFTVEDVERRVGPLYEIDVIDVSRQEDHKMLMRNWTEYYNSPDRHKILNVISLEFSKTRLSELVDPPTVVRQVSWVSTLWPDDMPEDLMPDRPEVQKYCLMGVKDSFTDFHIDFGGTSVWYHVLRGEKVFYLIQPTASNLALFENWLSSASQSETFFGDQVDRCWRCVVKQGQTLFIPTGWIHAVFTPIDSLVFGGNFLHSYNIPLQLEAYEIERRVKTPEKYLFPSYETVNWYAAKHILDNLKECSEDGREPKPYIVAGAVALAQLLKKWTQRKDYSRKSDGHHELEGIQYGKLIRALNAEIKHLENQINLDLLHQHTENKLKELEKEQRQNIYNFEGDEDEEIPASRVLKVRIPKAGAYVDKLQGEKPSLEASDAAASDTKPAAKLTKRKAAGGKKNKKNTSAEPSVKNEPSVNDESIKVEEKLQPLAALKFKVSNGKIVEPSDSADGTGDGKEKVLDPAVKKEEDDDSDKDALVVDENPQPRQTNKKNSAAKPGSLRLKLSISGKSKSQERVGGRSAGGGDAVLLSAKEDEIAWRLAMPTIRGGLNGSIADILEASGYGTETDFKVDDEVGSSSNMRDAIQGMLSMSRGASTLFAPLSRGGLLQQNLGKSMAASEEEEQLMADCYQDSEYVYPSFELSDEEQPSHKAGKNEERDDNWNPKVRVDVPQQATERTHRVGVKNQAVASGLAATAAKLAESPPVPKKSGKKSNKPKVAEKEFEVSPLPGPSTDFACSGSAFRPGIKRTDTSPVTQPSKAKKPKKGQATAKQRLGKILKIHKMVY